MKTYPISIIIPVYKNYQMFYQYLEINKKYFKGCELIIMNDYPEENISQQVKKIYPEAIVINNKKNLGFAANINKGVRLAKRPYVFLMNSDVVLKDDSFKKSINYFRKNKKLFALGFAQVEKDGSFVGKNKIYWQNGILHHKKVDTLSFGNNAWAEAGACIIDRKKFLKLEGFDTIYFPFYWEDIDLSYKAWKVGYEVNFTPDIIVNHHHESTIGKYFQPKKILRTAFRNQLIFHWKNLTDKDLLIKHILNLPKNIFRPGFFDALLRLHQILKARKKTVKLFKKTDKEILNNF